jgi:3-phenylpropionate/trans-cinnamate dioxygenase ferredoxin reductase subunit
MYFDDTAERFEGATRVGEVVTAKGRRIGCDFVVVGIGTQPNTEPADASGIAVERGILADPALRTNVAGVYAAGDVANHDNPLLGRIRVVQLDNAMKMGVHAAGSMLGGEEPYSDPHWFWSDQYDCNIQMAGFTLDWAEEELVVRGSEADRSFVAFRLQDGAIRAALGINKGRDVRRSLKLIAAQARVDRSKLADEDVDLRTLVDASS